MDILDKIKHPRDNGSRKIDSPRTARDTIPHRVNMPSALKNGSTDGMNSNNPKNTWNFGNSKNGGYDKK